MNNKKDEWEGESLIFFICTIGQNISCVGDGALDVSKISMVIIKYNLLERDVKDAVLYSNNDMS